jgi:hypothetical protein
MSGGEPVGRKRARRGSPAEQSDGSFSVTPLISGTPAGIYRADVSSGSSGLSSRAVLTGRPSGRRFMFPDAWGCIPGIRQDSNMVHTDGWGRPRARSHIEGFLSSRCDARSTSICYFQGDAKSLAAAGRRHLIYQSLLGAPDRAP